jgi:hypothetical protein
VGFFKHDNTHYISISGTEFLDHFRDYEIPTLEYNLVSRIYFKWQIKPMEYLGEDIHCSYVFQHYLPKLFEHKGTEGRKKGTINKRGGKGLQEGGGK